MESQITKQLAQLAMESELSVNVDWTVLNVDKEEAFETMAAKVYEQLDAVPEDQRAIVAMATMTRLLVENFVLKHHLSRTANE